VSGLVTIEKRCLMDSSSTPQREQVVNKSMPHPCNVDKVLGLLTLILRNSMENLDGILDHILKFKVFLVLLGLRILE